MSISINKNPTRSYPLNILESIRLTCNWFENPEKIGIPKDIVIKIYNDHNKLQVKNCSQLNNLIKVVYIQDTVSDTELLNLLHIISLFNQINSIALFIYCDEKYAAALQNYSNEHIHFIIKNPDTINHVPSIETDVIITYGPGVIHFIKQNFPVVIVGPYGLGGWITPNNLPYLLNSGFVGRAGGTLGEFIPVEVFANELLLIKECKDLSSILTANKLFVEGLPCRPFSDAQEIIDKHIALKKQLKDSKTRWQMIPFVASNIMFEQCTETFTIKRRYINDTLCTVSKEDIPFFQAINGKTTCESLCKASQMDEYDFWEIMYTLNDKTIILF